MVVCLLQVAWHCLWLRKFLSQSPNEPVRRASATSRVGRVELSGRGWSNGALGLSGAFSVPDDLLAEFPDLTTALRQPVQPWGGVGGFNPDYWGFDDLRPSGVEFARVVGEWGRTAVAQLVETYWLAWPWFAAATFETQRPDLYAALERSRLAGKLTTSSVTYNSVMYGSAAAQTYLWAGWKPSEPIPCALCGRVFEPIAAHPKLVAIGVGHHLCGYCSAAVVKSSLLSSGESHTSDLSDEELGVRLRKVVQVLGFVPPAKFRYQLQMRAIDPARRRRLEAALVCLPRIDVFYERFGKPWTKVLIATSVVDGVRVTSRGTMAVASDGHLCRSLGELAIDDYLTNSRIEHDTEPPWPAHPELNPNGRQRGDWLLLDGTYVEYAGLTGDVAYDRRMATKVRLASELGIPLLVVYPSDLNRLDEVFAPYKPATDTG